MYFFFFLSVLCFCGRAIATNPSVIIIGAGPAGIAAATKLLENSMTNIKLIEAENRIGGRINSIRLGQGFVDLGAEYCHGQKNNIVYQLAKDLDLLEPISPIFEPKLRYSNGSRLDPLFTEELQAVILGYDSNNFEYNATGLSIGQLFLKKYNATIIQRYIRDSEKLKLLREALRLAEKVSLMIDGSFSWLDTSTVKHYQRSEGHQLLVWKGRGYKTIIDILTKRYPSPKNQLPIGDKIILNTEVTKIVWNDNETVRVQTADNTSFQADHVIFTPSVGVLKEQDLLFDPPLPQKKLKAIEAIGIAGVMKIILHFEEEWWHSDDVVFAFLWSEEDLVNIVQEFEYGPVQNGISWVSAITVMAKVPGNANVLVAWVTGELVPEIENTPLEILKDGCVYLLDKFLGRDYNVTAPDKILKSSWRSNGHFRGTYSYERSGFEEENVHYQVDLSEPLINNEGRAVVLFAGEATNPIHYSTVHGAVESGHREAERLINLYKNH